MKTVRVVLSVLTLVISIPLWVAAESTVWSAVQPSLAHVTPGAYRSTITLANPSVSVSYAATLWEVDAGGAKIRSIPNGSSVPKGTRILFEFTPHTYTDISWFGTGAAFDSPYGDWIAGAVEPPASERCATKNLYMSRAWIDDMWNKTSYTDLYAALAVAPPPKEVEVTGAGISCSNSGGDGNKICIASSEGTITARFVFKPTRGEFYVGEQRTGQDCDSHPGAMSLHNTRATRDQMTSIGNHSAVTAGDYQLNVPEQAIPFTLIIGNADGKPPIAPQVVGLNSQCIVGTAYTIRMQATDPDNDHIRYAIDWDNNGTIDQYVPASGYVSSGSAMTASRTYSTEGSKTVRVFTQDEKGLLSPATTYSFTCVLPTTPDTDNGDDGSGGFNGDNGLNGRAGSGGNATGSIRAVPSLVKSGGTSRITWSAENVLSCTVRGDNGDAWEGASGSKMSGAIMTRTVYTLTCQTETGTLTDTASVNILPKTEEI